MVYNLPAASHFYKNPVVLTVSFVSASYLIGNLCAYVMVAVLHLLKLNISILTTDVIADFLAGEVCLLLGVVVATYVLSHFFKEPVFSTWRGPIWNILLGVFAGLALGLLLNVLQVRILERFHLYINNQETQFPFTRVLLLSLLVAIAEETLYRGYVFQVLQRKWGTGLAISVTSFVFAGAHLFNPGWASTFRNVCDTISVVASGGLLFSSCLLLTRRMWMPISLHFCWDFFHTLLYGDGARGITSWSNAAFNSQRVDESSAVLSFITGVMLLLLAIRRGNWKSVRSCIPCGNSNVPLPTSPSVQAEDRVV